MSNSDTKTTQELSAHRPLAMGIREAAEVVGVSPSFIRKMLDAGELKRTRLGRRVVIKETDLIEWLNRSDETAAA